MFIGLAFGVLSLQNVALEVLANIHVGLNLIESLCMLQAMRSIKLHHQRVIVERSGIE